ncbi:hypothetical protein [Leadbetterella byssophila]|uniref:hypothetical protein n=1 Tax=Leadbetterella byssophila TaxID=316068 RepID=UPI0039A06A1E
MKSNSNTRPAALLDLGDGSWHYNFNIEEVEVTVGEIVETRFEYDTVQFWGPPSYAKLVKAVIRDRFDETQEFSIINDYNAHILGVSENEDAVARYADFLQWKEDIKAMVENDLNPPSQEE